MMRPLAGVAGVLLCVGLVLAQDTTKQRVVVKLVDPEMGKMVVTVTDAQGGTKVVAYDIGKGVKILDAKGKKLKGGLKNDVFKSSNNRPAVPISITLNADGSVKSIRLSK